MCDVRQIYLEDDNQNHISLYRLYSSIIFIWLHDFEFCGCILVEYREICNDGKQTYCLDGNPVFLWVITYLVTKYYCVHIFRAQNYLELDVGFFFKKRLFAYLVL